MSILGGEEFDRQVLLGIAKNEIEVEIILPFHKPHDKNIKKWHISYLPISHFPAFMGNILYLMKLFKIYKKNKFQILRIHQPQFLGLGCLFFRLFHPKVKLVATYHQFNEANFGPFSEKINHYWDHIVCDSTNVKNKIIAKYKIKKEKISVVHNGYPNYLKPTTKDKVLSNKLNLDSKFVLMFMGFLNTRKNPLFLLEVLEKIKDKYKNVNLIYIGEGPLKKEITAIISKKSLQSYVQILEPVFNNDKLKLLNLADIFLHPSTDEGFALAPIEAMACGKPVLMNDAHSAREAIDENGFLCSKNSADDWVKKIEYLYNSQNLRHKMGKRSLEKARKEFSWDIVTKKHLEIFNSINRHD